MNAPIEKREQLTRDLVQQIISALEVCLKQAKPDSPECAMAHKLLDSFRNQGVTLADVAKHLRDGTNPSGVESYFKDILLKFLGECSEVGRKTWKDDPEIDSEEYYTGVPSQTPPRPR